MGDFLRKQTNRAKEKLMTTLGKNDRTVDEDFDEQYVNFVKQQASADKLTKAMRHYVSCIKQTQLAAKQFNEVLREVYEPNWPGKDHTTAMTQSLDLLWEDYHDKLCDQVHNPLIGYNAQFAEIAKKVDKRGRKLLDYDSARHNLMALSTATTKKSDEMKMTKAQEQLASAQQMYAQLNDDLLDELPSLWDNRIVFLTTNIQTHFNVAYSFHNESAKVSRDLAACVDTLGQGIDDLRVTRPAPKRYSTYGTASADEQPSPRGSGASSPGEQPKRPSTDVSLTKRASTVSSNSEEKAKRPMQPPPGKPAVVQSVEDSPEGEETGTEVEEEAGTSTPPKAVYPSLSVDSDPTNPFGKEDVPKTPTIEEPIVEQHSPAQPQSAPPPAPKSPLPTPPTSDIPGVLFLCIATHAYKAEDTDELSFEAGEIIKVVPYDDPEEQDDGWQMGIRPDGVKGVFPENFTKRQ